MKAMYISKNKFIAVWKELLQFSGMSKEQILERVYTDLNAVDMRKLPAYRTKKCEIEKEEVEYILNNYESFIKRYEEELVKYK